MGPTKLLNSFKLNELLNSLKNFPIFKHYESRGLGQMKPHAHRGILSSLSCIHMWFSLLHMCVGDFLSYICVPVVFRSSKCAGDSIWLNRLVRYPQRERE